MAKLVEVEATLVEGAKAKVELTNRARIAEDRTNMIYLSSIDCKRQKVKII
jgi:hypothetical protein